MPSILDRTTIGNVDVVVVDTNPSVGGIFLPIGSFGISIDGSGIFYKSGSLSTDWGKLLQNNDSASITAIGTITTGVWNATPITDTYISSATNWNTAYTNRITSLTTTGNSGAATLVANVLNIPTYTLAGLGGQPLNTNLTSLSGLTYVSASFVKMTAAGTFVLDTNIYLTSNQNITLSGDVTGAGTTAITATISNTTVTGKLLTGYISGAGTIAATDSILSAIQKLNGNTAALITGVSSVFGRTGTVIAIAGDYTTTLVTEGTNLYFNNARAISSTLTGYVSGAGTISATDSILSAIQKLNGNITASVTGVTSVSGTTNRITSTGGVTPIIDIASTYIGQSSITTLGTITTGIWNGTSINTTYTDAKIKGGIAATVGLIPFGTGTADTLTTSTQFTYTPTLTGSTINNTTNLCNISTLPSTDSAQTIWMGYYNAVTLPSTLAPNSGYAGFYNNIISSGGLSANGLSAGANVIRVGSNATTFKYKFTTGSGPNAAVGTFSSSIGPSTTGVNFGVYGTSLGSAISNIGVAGIASASSGAGSNYGVMGISNPVSGIGNAAGYFALSTNDPTDANAAVIADNGASSYPIFLGRVNAVVKMSIDAFGKIITLASTTSSASINIPSGVNPTVPTAGDIYNNSGTIVLANTNLLVNSTATPHSTLQANGSFALPYVTKSSAYTLTISDYVVELTGTPFTVTLPTAVGITGRIYIIKNTSGATKTIATTSSQTIDGSITQTITGRNWIYVQSTGTNWIIIG